MFSSSLFIYFFRSLSQFLYFAYFSFSGQGRKDNIKMDLKETGWVAAQFMRVAQEGGAPSGKTAGFHKRQEIFFFHYRGEYYILADG
jgi:hypothetical protein